MYLVFDLPEPGGSVFPTAHTVAFLLHRELDAWHEKHQIPYKTKYHKNRLRLIFSNENEYYFFMLSWNPNMLINGNRLDSKWAVVTVVDPPKH